MRILGLLFILFGLPLCFTLIWTMPGIAFVGVGALLRIAAHKTPAGRGTRIAEGAIIGCFVLMILGLMIPVWLGVRAKAVDAAPVKSAVQSPSQKQHKHLKHPVTTGSQSQ